MSRHLAEPGRMPWETRAFLFALLIVSVSARPILAAPGVNPVAGPPPAPPDVRPAAIENVGVDQQLGTKLPLDLLFRDHAGRTLRLRELFADGKPAILSFNYSRCPMLCESQLTGLVRGLSQLNLRVGQDFRVISISLDPSDTVERAAAARRKYAGLYGGSGGETGWHFLIGDGRGIEQITRAAGFRYQYLPGLNEYSHAAAALVITPEGTISRYLFGVEYLESSLRLALVEASRGTVGSWSDQWVLLCFTHDPDTGRYVPNLARMTMTGAGALTVMILGGSLLSFWCRDRSRIEPLPTPGPEKLTIATPTGTAEKTGTAQNAAAAETTPHPPLS